MTILSKYKIKRFDTLEMLSQSAANFCLQVANQSVKEHGYFSFCLSGGDTPKMLYHILATHPYLELFPWENTNIFWGDERCVPPKDSRNNAFMVDQTLLRKVNIPSSHIFSIPVDVAPAEAASQYEQLLKSFFEDKPVGFDLILLGLGTDGHTASLFPGSTVLAEKEHWVKEVFVKAQQMYRITLTVPFINRSKRVMFLVSGTEKASILHEVLNKSFPPTKYPAQLITVPEGEIYWYVDKPAASHLSGIEEG